MVADLGVGHVLAEGHDAKRCATCIVEAERSRADYYEGHDLIYYVMDLEALIRWFALPFRYQTQEGEWVQNEPIWTVYDERGDYLPENDRLERTWRKVMGETVRRPPRPEPETMYERVERPDGTFDFVPLGGST